jgi:hypothetical protein
MRRGVIWIALVLFFGLAKQAEAACQGSAPNWIAPTWMDVVLCQQVAMNGDRITVTSGSYTATARTEITKYLQIVAANVTVLDNTPGFTEDMITFVESAAGNTKLSGPLTINQGSSSHNESSGVVGINNAVGGKPVLVTGVNYIMVGGSGNFFYVRTNRGVLWNNHGLGVVSGPACLNNSSFLRHKWTGGGIEAWKKPAVYGAADVNGDQSLYAEGNTVNRMLEGLDADDNARLVWRYNTVINSGGGTHGVDTSGIIGGRYIDYYGNIFVRDMTPQPGCIIDGQQAPVNMNGFIAVRGGTVLIHDNVIPDINDGWWGQKSEVTFLYENLRRNSGGYPCWNTATAPGAGYPAPHNTGWGFSTGLSNPGNLGANVLQDIEPMYLWGNTGAGNYNNPGVVDYPNECGPLAPFVSGYIQSGREYYLNTAKPGYTPYVYPHPLASGVTPPPTPTPPPVTLYEILVNNQVRASGGIPLSFQLKQNCAPNQGCKVEVREKK